MAIKSSPFGPTILTGADAEAFRRQTGIDAETRVTITNYEREILEALNESGGFTTGQVARHVTMFGSNARQHIGAVRSWLMGLKKRGLVDFLDDQKPVCWIRTATGSATLLSPR